MEWIAERTQNNRTFLFFRNNEEFETYGLSAVRGLKEKNFQMYIDCMEYVCYYVFTLDIQTINDGFLFTSKTWGHFQQMFDHYLMKEAAYSAKQQNCLFSYH